MLRRAPQRMVIGIAIATAAIAFPLGVVASHRFSDVPTTNTFHGDIDAIADAGVTVGCSPTTYCPKDYVTREQMAAFLNRLGALGPGKVPVVNADKVDGKDEVLGAGDIVMVEYGPWMLYTPTNARIQPSGDAAYVFPGSAGATEGLTISLQAPASIDGRTFGLKSVEICWGASAGTIDDLSAYQALVDGYIELAENNDGASLASGGCLTATDPTPNTVVGGVNATFRIYFSGSNVAALKFARATWTPTTTAP